MVYPILHTIMDAMDELCAETEHHKVLTLRALWHVHLPKQDLEPELYVLYLEHKRAIEQSLPLLRTQRGRED